MQKDKNLIIAIGLIFVAIVLMVVFNFAGKSNNSSTTINKDSSVKIVANEVNSLELEDYANDALSMKKPKGWQVEAAGTGMYYAIKVYDPSDTNNGLFLMLKMQPLLKSDAAKKQWTEYYKLAGSQYRLFADAIVLYTPTTERFYQKFNEIAKYMNDIEPTLSNFKFPTYTNSTKLEEQESVASMKNVSLDSKVLRATFTGENNKQGEGMFLASIVNFGNQYSNGIDSGYYMVYDIMTITSSENKFIDYKDLLLESINSIKFNDSYVQKTIDDGNAQTKQALELSAQIQKSFDSYMSAWENRNKTYDIMSQKQSDATLGYERVYDTETGDIYKAYNGFTDEYDGERYKSVTDEMYTEKTNGYIEK